VQGDGWRGRVLLADNDAATLALAKPALLRAGYRVVVSTQGTRALVRSRAAHFDVLVVARDLPALNGLEVARIIRQREEGARQAARAAGGVGLAAAAPPVKRLPIIVLSAATAPENLREFMEVCVRVWWVEIVSDGAVIETERSW
jgi:CheY-like chemotaxis protein